MHIPVLLHEVVEVLDPKPGEFFIDGTLGGGGHARALLKRLEPGGSFLAVDRDAKAVSLFAASLKEDKPKMKRVMIERANYVQVPTILQRQKLPPADGLLLDLGFSSDQLIGRGFSFQRDEPLLMTYDDDAEAVEHILGRIGESELAKVISELGEERYAQQIAAEIIARRPIRTTKELSEAVIAAVPKNYERFRIHPATRTFMALRIYANAELVHLETFLKHLPEMMRQAEGGQAGGRVAIITFHSLEDRIVKHYLQSQAKVGNIALINKKPMIASAAELAQNPRARSAKLRAAVFI